MTDMPPTTKAAITPALSFFLWFFNVDGNDEGEGGSERGEQSGKGDPHNREFPRKDDMGNLVNELGIEPFSLLKLKFSSLSLGRSKSGTEP